MAIVCGGYRFRLTFIILAVLSFQSCCGIRSRLTWINGIGHTIQHMEEGQTFISALFCGKTVEWCHNPTAMAHDDDWRGYLGDLTQATTQKLGKITAEVDSLTKHLQKAIQRVGKRGVVVHIAHSQGALITALACKHLTPQEMNQMEVICFGGAACLQQTPATPFRRCMNYYAVNDPLLLLNPEALQALRSGFVETEFCFLSPRLGDPILDHALLSPTYAQALEWEGARFEKLYVPMLYRVWRRMRHMILLLYVAMEAKVVEAFKAMLRPVMRWSAAVAEPIYRRILEPILLVLLLFVDWIATLIRRDKNSYVPVATLRDDKAKC